MFKSIYLTLVCFIIVPLFAFADIALPTVFSDNMVLQRNTVVKIWGWAEPLEEITVKVSWKEHEVKTEVKNNAEWEVSLKTPDAGGPYEITITGNSEKIVLKNVFVGEVWICSGQSNMEWSAKSGITNGVEEIPQADFPQIKLFNVEKRSAECTQNNIVGEWQTCTPETMETFSAVGYFFARHLHQNLNIPIGIINSSWGATPAEAWMSAEIFKNDSELLKASKLIPDKPWCPVEPGSVFNSMIAPITNYKIAGVIWYQGETNTDNATYYESVFSNLIKSWRKERDSDFPFYYVQIAPYKYEKKEVGVEVREAQRKCLVLPNTGMVVVSDIGNIDDIHPRNKKDVGIRLANWALAKTYKISDIAYSGPLYKRMVVSGKKVRVYFDFAQDGLMVKGNSLSHFEIAGANNKFYKADAFIEDSTVVVSSGQVDNPKRVRFAWSNAAEPNLFNSHELPASCFITE